MRVAGVPHGRGREGSKSVLPYCRTNIGKFRETSTGARQSILDLGEQVSGSPQASKQFDSHMTQASDFVVPPPVAGRYRLHGYAVAH